MPARKGFSAIRRGPAVDYLNGGNTPKTLLVGSHSPGAGRFRRGRALSLNRRARNFASAVEQSPLIANVHANLGLALAFLNRKEDAIREGRRAVELRPIAKDAVDGAIMLCYLAVIYAQTGENDQARLADPGVTENSRRD